MRKANLMLSGALIVFSGFVYYMISKLPKEAALYPLFVTSLFFILSIMLLYKSYVDKDNKEESSFKNLEFKQLLFVLISSGLYVALINVLGYILATFAYVLVTLFGLRIKKINSLLISLGFCLFVYVVFKIFLNVPLPKGIII